jgi:predicted RNA-binding Zn-ribbon protein involved in translation (DUF1610 family)
VRPQQIRLLPALRYAGHVLRAAAQHHANPANLAQNPAAAIRRVVLMPCVCITCRSRFRANEVVNCPDCGDLRCPRCGMHGGMYTIEARPYNVPPYLAASVRASVWGRAN